MGISAEDLVVIDKLVNDMSAMPVLFAKLRSLLPHLSLTRCDAADVLEIPFRVYANCELYLVTNDRHCIEITENPSRASGIILALREATI